MRATRTTFGTFLILAVSSISLLSLGCPPPKKSTAVKQTVTSTGEPNSTTPVKGKDAPPPQTAKQFAEEFLKAVTEGKATPEQLSVNFKKTVFALPKFAEEEKLGYSDTDAKQWLKKPGNPVYTIDREVTRTKPVAQSVFRGTVKVADKSETFLLRVAKNPTSSKWEVDSFAQFASGGPGPIAEDTDSAPAIDALQFFLDNLLFGDLNMAASTMSPTLKKTMAPPFSTDKLGYNSGYLEAQLKDRRTLYKGYTYTAPVASGDSYTFTVEMLPAKSLTIKVTKDKTSGIWLVDGI